MDPMWKTSHPERLADQKPEPTAQSPPPLEPAQHTKTEAMPIEQSKIGKGLIVRGDISGTDSLFIDGTIDGSVNIPSGRVTVGLSGHVEAEPNAGKSVCIAAHEIVIGGSVRGHVSAADRVEIRAEGKLTGDVSTPRISIADGGFFKGFIGVRNAGIKAEESGVVPVEASPATAKVIQIDRERRSAARYKLQLPVIFHWNEDGERTTGGFTSDVALDGVLINSGEYPAVGSDVRIQLLIHSPLQDGKELRIHCAGKVTRVMEHGGRMSFGVRGNFNDDRLTPIFKHPS